MTTHPLYPTVLSLLKSHSSSTPRALLDLGTCVGQDVRKLIHDGAPVECVYGSDLLAGYEGVGHALFRDEDKLKGHFIQSDILDQAPDSPLAKTRGTWDVVNINMFLHGFVWDEQVSACKSILKLLKPEPGSLVMGMQSASTKCGAVTFGAPFLPEGEEREIFVHDTDSFTKMWEDIGKSEGVELKIAASYQAKLELGKAPDGSKQTKRAPFFPNTEGGEQRRMCFSIERV